MSQNPPLKPLKWYRKLAARKGRLEEETMDLAQRIAQGPPIALRLDKIMIYKGLGTDLETALAFASACENITLHTQDHVEGVTAFVQKRQPQFQGR